MMLVKDFECRSFEAAEKLLEGKSQQRVCNNTILWRMEDQSNRIFLVLHGHAIVQFHRDGSTQLWSKGFKTVTTKDRISRCLPELWRLAQRKFQWHLWNYKTEEERPFFDGMSISGSGTVES